jgi:hypothetical protein
MDCRVKPAMTLDECQQDMAQLEHFGSELRRRYLPMIISDSVTPPKPRNL